MSDAARPGGAGPADLAQVAAQYEALPYPPRDPAEERRRLIHRSGDNLIYLNHHCFGGQRDFRAGFRALVAGGGTGDSTVYLAEQLRGFGAEVVHLDFSAASLAVARARAGVRGLDAITWVHDSLLNLPQLGLGDFDYINCTGVLHHLESSEAGLAVLAGALRPGGAMLLMLYGKYGRRSVYDMQALLRRYLPPGAGIAEKIRLARQFLGALPASNSFVRDLDAWREEISPGGFGDAGLYDLLLHSQDRCFDVPAIHALTDSAGLAILAYADRAPDYEPRTHLGAAGPGPHLAGLGPVERAALAELMVGNLNSHEFYLGRPGANRAADIEDEDNALVLMGKAHGHHREIAAGMGSGGSVTLSGRGGTATVAGTAFNCLLFSLMDGATPLAGVYAKLQAAAPDLGADAVRRQVHDLYRPLAAQGHVCLLRAGHYGSRVPDYSRLPPP